MESCIEKGYKRLIGLLISSIIFFSLIVTFFLINPKTIILFSLSFGLSSQVYFLYMIIKSLKSKEKWSVIITFNDYNEGFFEIIFLSIIIIIEIFSIILSFLILFPK